ncbi:carboxypeptidase regulatory-like domain-containing protein [Paludibaculum fermentans]|uniref:carboxypeptidase regulatory-like domain-containing protein n=1 Tax=Paludibaculum fermentans TaxID=1473598 RepID=UPI003EBC2B72
MKLAAWLCFAPTLIYAQAVTVTGTVTNAATQEPIAGVTIRVFGSNDIQETSTDARGVFRAQGLENCCRVLFDKEGFAAVGPSNLLFRAAVNEPPLKLTMLPWPVLRGRVLDAERRPMPGSTVEAISLSSGRKTVQTGADGSFAFERNLRPGEYVVLATPPAPPSSESTGLAPTYFPDGTERSAAAKLMLKAADELSGYDIVLRQVPLFAVAGTVVDERGEPAAGAVLQVPGATTKATADGNGRFRWRGVRPGDAMVQADWSRDGVALRGFTAITVRQRDLDEVRVRVTPSVAVSGTVELDGKPAAVEGMAELEPVNGDGSLARASFLPSGLSSGLASGLRFDGVYPGRYRLQVSASTGFAHSMYLDSVKLGERDLLLEEFDVPPEPLAFRVIFKTGGGRVSGTVRDGAGGIIVLVPRDERQRIPERTAVSFFSGSVFQVENVRPGEYYGFAVRGVFNHGQMSDPAYAARVLSGAPAIRVELNGTATATLGYVDNPALP